LAKSNIVYGNATDSYIIQEATRSQCNNTGKNHIVMFISDEYKVLTRHRASTSMYSLTFCVRVMLPERHHWKPAGQAAAVMLRTPPVDGQLPASQPRPLAIYGTQLRERPRHPPVTNQQRGQTPRKLGFALCYHSNATRAPIANPPNSAQLGGSLSHASKLHPGPCSNVGVRPRTDRHADTRDHNTFCVVYDSRKM